MKITNNTQLLQKKNIAGIILKPNSSNLKNIYQDIKKLCLQYNIDVLIEKSSAIMIDEDGGVDFDLLCQQSDFLITLGGDGTLISVSRRSFLYKKPILGINLGTLGFLTSIMPNEFELFLNNFTKDQYVIDKRMMINATINLNNSVAFNDIVIKGKSVTHMVTIDAYINGEKFNSYYGDGLVICTPTGSTAYNLSSGGPIVYPLTDAFIITPISAHSLTQRPLVLPTNFEIEFSIPDNDGAVVIVDGQDIYEINKNDTIKINIASSKAKLIRPKNRDYFNVLNEKLQWGKLV